MSVTKQIAMMATELMEMAAQAFVLLNKTGIARELDQDLASMLSPLLLKLLTFRFQTNLLVSSRLLSNLARGFPLLLLGKLLWMILELN